MNTRYLLLTLTFLLGSVVFATESDPLKRLQEGNERYVKSTTVCHEDWTAKRSALVNHQKPFAIIVC